MDKIESVKKGKYKINIYQDFDSENPFTEWDGEER